VQPSLDLRYLAISGPIGDGSFFVGANKIGIFEIIRDTSGFPQRLSLFCSISADDLCGSRLVCVSWLSGTEVLASYEMNPAAGRAGGEVRRWDLHTLVSPLVSGLSPQALGAAEAGASRTGDVVYTHQCAVGRMVVSGAHRSLCLLDSASLEPVVSMPNVCGALIADMGRFGGEVGGSAHHFFVAVHGAKRVGVWSTRLLRK
jgi:hypothetical protein